MVLTVRGMKDIIGDMVRTTATPTPRLSVGVAQGRNSPQRRADPLADELVHKYLCSLEREAAHPSPKHECTPFSPSLSSLTLCPPLTDKTNHPSGINFPSPTSEAFPFKCRHDVLHGEFSG